MQTELRSLLDTLFQEGQANDASQEDQLQKKLNLAPESAQFISFLVHSSKRRRILEIGTSNGYSTIWLAWAASQTDGKIISIDRAASKHAQANLNLSKAGLRELVELRCGDATEVVAGLPGPFDCLFFDADRLSAPQQLALLLPKLMPDALILADNALSHPSEIADYLAALRTLTDFEQMILPIGKGLSVAYRSGTRS
jgi:predicted O-methyltransferase YrrM